MKIGFTGVVAVGRCLPMALALGLCGCGEQTPPTAAGHVDTLPVVVAPATGHAVPAQYARTFRIVDHGAYRVVALRANIVSWGGSAKGPEQRIDVVLVPKDSPVPTLPAALADAIVVRTPVQRIALNLAPFEAMLRELGIDDRIVAVGGAKSWDDALRAKALGGEVAQVGYGWHMPPMIEPLLAARPDVFVMALGDLDHVQHFERIQSLGVPVVPMFLDAEPHYLGKVEYIRLMGALTGREAEAEAFVAEVFGKVEELKARAAAQPTRSVMSTWFAGGNRWMATVRNAEAQLLRDANGRNLLEEPDDPRLDAFTYLSTESLIERGRDAQCWIARDTHSKPFDRPEIMAQFRSVQEGCVFAITGGVKPEADAFDYYETAVIRPERMLGDLVRMLHPPLRDAPFVYLEAESKQP